MDDLGEHLLTSEQKLAAWGVGEWVEEIDKYEFEYKGYKCLAMRIYHFHTDEIIGLGHLCGYLVIPPRHPWNGKDYDDLDCSVHGGITCSGYGRRIDLQEGEFVIGFDCAHSCDICPGVERSLIDCREGLPNWVKEATKDSPIFNRSYKNVAFVVDQLKSLVDQAICAQA